MCVGLFHSCTSLKTDLAISHNVQQSNDIWASRQVLQDLDLPLDLLLLDGFQDFDDTLLAGGEMDRLKHLIRSASH
jgi:hypothetical protein